MACSVDALKADSLTTAIGMLYQRKQAGAALIRVLEKYKRDGASSGARCFRPSNRQATTRAGRTHRETDITAYRQKLERLYFRRAVVDELIRSIEAYTRLSRPTTGRAAGPQANQ